MANAEEQARKLLEQAEASAKRLFANANEQAERMLGLNRQLWNHRTPDPTGDVRAQEIAAELQTNPELKAKVMALVGVPAPPAPG